MPPWPRRPKLPSMATAKLLLVEDDPDLLEILHLTFEREGYTLLLAKDGEEALRRAQRHGPDLVVLDVMLPGMDGFEVCRRLRADPNLRRTLVLMVTARSEEADVVLGLGVGADDYVCKPARPRELVARVEALLRRADRNSIASEEEGIRTFGTLVLDPQRFELRVEDRPVVLTPTEFRLLRTLMSSPGRVFRRAELLDSSVGAGAVVDERNVDSHVKALRKKLGPAGTLIETVRGVGYRLADHGG